MQIYKITNIINEKSYIGKDKFNSENYFGSGKLIRLAIKKYGIKNFRKDIIQECSSMNDMDEKEIFWIKELNTISPNGYNIAKGGNGGDTTSNNPNKKEIIEKRRIANIGKKRTPEFCKKIQKIAKNVDINIRIKAGKKAAQTKKKRIQKVGYTEKEIISHNYFKEKLIESNKSPEGRKRVSFQFKGKKLKPFTEEHRKNIGLASKGRKIPGKKIIIENIKYESLHDAHRKLNIPLMTIKNRILNNNFKEWNFSDNEI